MIILILNVFEKLSPKFYVFVSNLHFIFCQKNIHAQEIYGSRPIPSSNVISYQSKFYIPHIKATDQRLKINFKTTTSLSSFLTKVETEYPGWLKLP